MGFTESFNYVLYDNPISQSVTSVTKQVLKPIIRSANGLVSGPPPVQIITKTEPLWTLARQQGPFVKIAAISGAAATALAAYGAHKKYPKDKVTELKAVYENASRIHYFHTLALFGVTLTSTPALCGSLLVIGTMLFSGPCYYYAFTGENKFGKLAPIGGTVLILGWLAMLF